MYENIKTVLGVTIIFTSILLAPLTIQTLTSNLGIKVVGKGTVPTTTDWSSYPESISFPLTATPDAEWKFSNWVINYDTSTWWDQPSHNLFNKSISIEAIYYL